MSIKMVKCKACGQEIASTAKTCPNCGAKNNKPIYKKWWFWVIIGIVLIGIIAGTNGKGDNTNSGTNSNSSKTEVSETTVDYEAYEVTELLDALKANALKAQNDLKGKYVAIHGYLSNVDSDGKYISVGAPQNDYNYIFQNVHCNIKLSNKEEIVNKILEMNIDDEILVKGKITDVGEVLGIYLDIDSVQ